VYAIDTPQQRIYVWCGISLNEVFLLEFGDYKNTLLDNCTIGQFHHLMAALGVKPKEKL
jgi:hypothetical protein